MYVKSLNLYTVKHMKSNTSWAVKIYCIFKHNFVSYWMAIFFPGGKKMLLLMPFLLYDVKNHCPDFTESFLKYIQVDLEKKKKNLGVWIKREKFWRLSFCEHREKNFWALKVTLKCTIRIIGGIWNFHKKYSLAV